MPKAGTGWLYDQLEAHPDFWMPPVKELVYLNQEYPALVFVDERGEVVLNRKTRIARERGQVSPGARPPTGERRVHRHRLDERDVAFLRYAATGHGKLLDLEFYAGLFRFKGGLLSGDITPPYCNIESELIERIARRLPASKILLLVRDPVARVWSRICMSHAGKGFDTDLLNDTAAFRTYVERNRKLGGLSATQTWKRWQQHAPDMKRGFFFFDDLASEPERVRREILAFLGADPGIRSADIAPDYNRKAKTKLEMTPLAREVLIDRFRDELLASAEVFGGPARGWPAAYGL
jgi:hypothetical protein